MSKPCIFSRTDLVLCVSADGWSLHQPGSTDEQISNGDAPCLVSGPGEDPTDQDYEAALRMAEYRARHGRGRP